jgi:hypothetical protein
MTSSANLLAELRTLRARAREDRHGYAFSLLLFGVLILAAPLLYTPPADQEFDTDYGPGIRGANLLEQLFRTTAGPDPAHPTLIAAYWLFVLVAGFGATAWWYRRRAASAGIETGTRMFLVVAGTAFAGFVLGTWLLSPYTASLDGAWQVNLALMFGSLAVAALILWRTRHPAGVFAAAVCGAVAFSSIAVYTDKGFSALLVIAGGLLALAWLERSTLLGVVSVLFTLVAIPSTVMSFRFVSPMEPVAFLGLFGWQPYGVNTPAYVLGQVLLPATVLLAGGAIAAVRHRR